MCKPDYSCTINEAKNFEAAYVIAHEMAHSLGVMHDGNGNTCDSNINIMSDRTGAGKIHWSECSNMYLEDFVSKLGDRNCLANYPSDEADDKRIDEVQLSNEKLPGQQFDLKKQCQLAIGDQYKPYTTGSAPFDVSVSNFVLITFNNISSSSECLQRVVVCQLSFGCARPPSPRRKFMSR